MPYKAADDNAFDAWDLTKNRHPLEYIESTHTYITSFTESNRINVLLFFEAWKKTSATFLLFLGKKLNNENFVSLRSGLDTFFSKYKKPQSTSFVPLVHMSELHSLWNKKPAEKCSTYTYESIKETNESCCENSCQLCTQFPRKITKIQ